MPAHPIPPCPENWEPCDHCGAPPEGECRQPDYEENGRMKEYKGWVCPNSKQVCEDPLCGNAKGRPCDFTMGLKKVAPAAKHYLPQDDATRKTMPMARCLIDYFPAALGAVASHAYAANLKHNPGQEPHWARDKSTDHADCILRHLIERGQIEEVTLPGIETPIKLRASAALAWRALALLQQELEDEGAAPGRASRFPEANTGKTDGDFVAAVKRANPRGL